MEKSSFMSKDMVSLSWPDQTSWREHNALRQGGVDVESSKGLDQWWEFGRESGRIRT